MPKAHLLKPVAFVPHSCKEHLFIAHPGTPVFILETDQASVKILFKGFTKWVHESYLEIK